MLETGCGYACSFCEVATLRNLFGAQYRILQSDPSHSVEIIRNELKQTKNIEYIYFFDEDFLLKSEQWIDTFATLYADIGLPFFIFATPHSVLKSGEAKLRRLARVGLDTINFGIQTGSARIAKGLFGRKEDRAGVISVLKLLSSLYHEGAITSPPMADFIILNPYETAEDTAQTIELMRSMPLPFEAVIHCMSFFRGTPLTEKALNEKVIPSDYRFRFDLHDFVSRVRANEFERPFTTVEERAWFRHNILLAGMNGIHTEKVGERWFGSLTESELARHLEEDMSMDETIRLAESLPSPMSGVMFPWEKAFTTS